MASVSFCSAVTQTSSCRLTFVGMHLPLRTRNFSLPNIQSTQPPIRCVLGFSPRVKRRDRHGPHFCTALVKNVWKFISITPCTFMALYLIKGMGEFASYLLGLTHVVAVCIL